MPSATVRDVLLFESCQDLREVLCEVLSARGYRVRAFPSVAHLSESPTPAPQAILVAVDSEARSSRDDLSEVQRRWPAPRVPVLALVNGHAPVEAAGVALSLLKPVDEDRLCSALELCTRKGPAVP
ncbi:MULTISPECIES: hypothetical protein [Myxococcaceae]|uniref:hypothetical protein n=1 Tax=Myxococcaceae TaxID=31 RepID=UPI00129CB1C0|nr:MULTISPECIES: hypothetical protein [Myxococcaceae]MBF5042489.1 hypothetical protein [Simulacricoccus sp. 17bor-14]